MSFLRHPTQRELRLLVKAIDERKAELARLDALVAERRMQVPQELAEIEAAVGVKINAAFVGLAHAHELLRREN